MLKLKWTKSETNSSITWQSGSYKIIKYILTTDAYIAYFQDQHVRRPPDSTPCPAPGKVRCGSAHCRGWHRCWLTLGAAKRDCNRHAEMTQLHAASSAAVH